MAYIACTSDADKHQQFSKSRVKRYDGELHDTPGLALNNAD